MHGVSGVYTGLCHSCYDFTINGDEVGIDCGGSCPDCATCWDGLHNGDEMAVDCGGLCVLPKNLYPNPYGCLDGSSDTNACSSNMGTCCSDCSKCIAGIVAERVSGSSRTA